MEDQPQVPAQIQAAAAVELSQDEQDFQNFMKFHEIQMYAVQLPTGLDRKLYEKLKSEVFDIGFKVKIMVDHEEEKLNL